LTLEVDDDELFWLDGLDWLDGLLRDRLDDDLEDNDDSELNPPLVDIEEVD
jgi:hypothetical protein